MCMVPVMARFQSITSIANSPFRGRHNATQLVATALVVHRESERAIQCGVDGRPPTRRDGWLPKRAIIIHEGAAQPFIVASVPSNLLTEKKLRGMPHKLADGPHWTPENHLAFAWAQAFACRKRNEARRAAAGRGQMLTTFGRDEYA